MPHTSSAPSSPDHDADADLFYQAVVDAFVRGGVEFLVGGAYALSRHCGIDRRTKDLDLFLREQDLPQAEATLAAAGIATERTHPHWLAKANRGEVFVDLIFNSGNGITPVDEGWFDHAVEAEVLGRALRLVPAEELLWSKMFVMERERYDGADVAHLLRDRAADLDWARLVRRVGPHWRVLLSHLVLFGYVFPGERGRLPARLLQALLQRAAREHPQRPADAAAGAGVPECLCRGTLLSREQYLHDVQVLGYLDARLTPASSMDAEDVAAWTAAIEADRAA